MNFKMIRYITGRILQIEAALMCTGVAVAIIYRESALKMFILAVLITFACGTLLSLKKPSDTEIFTKEGLVCAALAWIFISIFGGLPFYLSGEIPSFIDCFFETVSGFTTTGSSILVNIEALSRCTLFWRSFTHWIGGMGILVFMLAIVSVAGAPSMHLMRAESPGPSVTKLVPKIRQTATLLYGIYLLLTAIQVVLLCFGKMSLYDSLVTTFGTAGTGGFSIYNDSIAHYHSVYAEGVITVFMVLFGVNFSVYYLILVRQFRAAFRHEEVRAYLLIIFACCALITVNLVRVYGSVFSAFRYASFQVASIITTTGYSTIDFNLWPMFSKTILVFLMIVGACAGSTGGGLKVSRFVICMKCIVKEIKQIGRAHV